MKTVYDRNMDLQDLTYRKHSVYSNVVNYLNHSGELLSLVNSAVCAGPKRVHIAEEIDFRKENLHCPEEIGRGFLDYLLEGAEGRDFRCPPVNSSVDPEKIGATVECIRDAVSEYISGIDSYTETVVIQTIAEKLSAYEENGDTDALLSLLGYGPGLTPLGDDVLLGMILCKNHLDYDEELNRRIADFSYRRTLIVSGSFLRSVCSCEYADDYSQLVKDVFQTGELQRDTLQRILNYGASSGYGIMIGFLTHLESCLKKG